MGRRVLYEIASAFSRQARGTAALAVQPVASGPEFGGLESNEADLSVA